MLVKQVNLMRVTRDTSVPDLIEKCRQVDNGMLIVWVHGGKVVKVAEVDKPAPIERIMAKAERGGRAAKVAEVDKPAPIERKAEEPVEPEAEDPVEPEAEDPIEPIEAKAEQSAKET